MGLRCLIGHDFRDPQTEREREERGDEVIVTVREYRSCARCGHQQVVSEGKEVRARSEGRSPEADPREAVEASTDEPETPENYGEIAAEDHGIILEDDEEEVPSDRQYGEWPAVDDEGDGVGDDPVPWPEVDFDDEPVIEEAEPNPWPETDEAANDEGFDAEPSDGGPAEAVEFRGGLTPERSADARDDDQVTVGEDDDPPEDDAEILEESLPNEPPTDDTPDEPPETDEEPVTSSSSMAPEQQPSTDDPPRSGIASASPTPSPSGQHRAIGTETEYVCPACEHTQPTTRSSLRPGDICPECGRGYLAERERN